MAVHVADVLSIFEQIDAIPRCSGNNEGIARWLQSWADSHSFASERDEAGNVLIRVPAKGASTRTVIIQGHMDMVCEKTPGSAHDFTRDPIQVIRDGDWIHANDTTLGADNGIAIAMALAVAAGEGPHPALEILVTVDEETGLTGAQKLREGWLTGTALINIDSEDEGVFTIGCAGGRDTRVTLPLTFVDAPSGLVYHELAVGGLMGGHSGVDIHLQRANANVLLARVLGELLADGVLLAHLRGGNAHNAIPRDAVALVGVRPEDAGRAEESVASWQQLFREEFGSTEPELIVELRAAGTPERVLAKESAESLVDLLLAIPHGVTRMSADVEGLVDTSTNLATVRFAEGEAKINTSQRSSFGSRLAELGGRIEAIARLAGAGAEMTTSYPPWEPAVRNDLLTAATRVYLKRFEKEPVIEIIHAGLECGVIGAKYPALDMLSLGPTIERAHSPEERLHVPSLERTCVFLDDLLAEL